jgi:heavy metal sensor kinase
MKPWNKLGTIRTRLTLWYVVLLGITVLSFSLYLQSELQTSLTEQIDTGLEVAASQLLVDVDDTVDPPTLRPMSETAVDRLIQSRFALRLITEAGEVVAEVGTFPPLLPKLPSISGFETVEIEGTSWRIYSQPVETQVRQFNTWLQMAQSLNSVYSARNSLLRLILVGLPIILMIATVIGSFMANRALRPVDTITRTVQTINATDMTQRIERYSATDELSRLTETLNSMLDRLQMAFESERRFTADASHELRTPLTSIKGQIGVTLTRQRTPDEYENTLLHIQNETDRLIRLVNDLLFLARLDTTQIRWQPEQVNLSHLLEAVVDQVQLMAAEKDITLHADIPEAIPVEGLPDHLIRLFLNLLDNAVKYTPIGGKIEMLAYQTKTDVCITIRDSGSGIPVEHLSHLFDRFYRVERHRVYNSGGTGLGLAIAYEIAREHNGTIHVQSEMNKGTSFTVQFHNLFKGTK